MHKYQLPQYLRQLKHLWPDHLKLHSVRAPFEARILLDQKLNMYWKSTMRVLHYRRSSTHRRSFQLEILKQRSPRSRALGFHRQKTGFQSRTPKQLSRRNRIPGVRPRMRQFRSFLPETPKQQFPRSRVFGAHSKKMPQSQRMVAKRTLHARCLVLTQPHLWHPRTQGIFLPQHQHLRGKLLRK
jgi:hypothetical protein